MALGQVMTIEKRISKARANLLLDFPWFGALSMNLRIEKCDDIQTFDVDGTTMRYNPEFAASLTDRELTGVLAHEVMHCALLHMFRREGRDPEGWNIATDYAINGELVKAGLTLPKGCLLDSKFDGLAAEVIYAQLRKGGQGKQGSPNPTGNVLDAPKPQGQGQQGPGAPQGQPVQPQQGPGQPGPSQGQGKPMTEEDWKIAAEQANRVATKAGKMPAGISRAIAGARESRHDWRQELREFLTETVPSDYSWQTPNRRFLHQGIYLPGTVKEGFGHMVIAIDTSGSIEADILNKFASEVNAIASDLKPEMITVLYCDAAINAKQEFPEGEEVTLAPQGGGGTKFSPVFEEIAQWEEMPKCLLYFTDLESYDQPLAPEYPVLWITEDHVTKGQPFGGLVRIPA